MEKRKIKILFVWPPELPYDITLHYHYTLFGETAAYFMSQKEFSVDLFDGGVLGYLKKEYIKKLLNGYDYLVIYSKVENTHSAIRSAEICKNLFSNTKIIAYGPACFYVPQFFEKYPFDAYVFGGDPEIAIESYIQLDQGFIKSSRLGGIVIGKKIKGKPMYLDPKLWGFPPLDKLPLKVYDYVVSQKQIGRFGKRQISVTVSRGCPYQCRFCFASLMFGKKERRRPISELITFVKTQKDNFDNIQFFSPNFTLNRDWVIKFCRILFKENIKIKWRCTTRVELLDEELIKIMGMAGCKSIGIGIETLDEKEQKKIGKKQNLEKIISRIKMIKRAGINSKAYIMLGLPGQTRETLFNTIKTLQEIGAEIRPSSYSPYQNLNRKSTLKEVAAMNRYTYNIDSVSGLSAVDYLKIILNRRLPNKNEHRN